ncbi:MAG: septum site-determining protein MinD [Clostridiales bacterium]|nr:septum site-determining protein MinD [Clostridiales bacterium]
MGKIYVVTSGKGGVGKSTVALNLAYALARGGRRVLLADMDAGLRSLDLMLGAQNELVFDLSDVLEGTCTAEQAIFPLRNRPGLELLPASQNSASLSLRPQDIRALFARLKDSYDHIFIDCPAGIERGFRNAVSAAESAILVVTPDNVSIRGGERTFQLLTSEGINDVSLIINRIGRSPALSTDECINRLELPVLGFVPDDPMVGRCQSLAESTLEEDCPAGDAFERIALRLLGQQVRYRIPYDSLIHRFKTHFGKASHAKAD